MRHRDATLNHKIENWVFADQTAREALSSALPEDIGKIAFQQSDNTYWRLTDDSPLTWIQLGGGGGGGGLVESPINKLGDDDIFDLSAISQAYKNLRIEAYFRCYNIDFDDVVSNLLIFFNTDYDDTGYRFSTLEDGVATKGIGAPIISKSSVYGAHKILIDLPLYSNVNAFPTCFARSGIQNAGGDFILRDSAIRNGGGTGAITDIRIKTSVARLELVGRVIFS